jgi:hypothetical protein
VAVAQTAPAQNLIVNSNFSTGDLSGWTVAETGGGGSPADYGVTAGNDDGHKVPNTGDIYGAYFNPAGGTIDLSQTVNLPAAGIYTVTCSVQPVFNDQDTLTIYLAGAPVFTTNFEFGMPYVPISVSVTASAGPQVIDFQFSPGSGPIFFDDAGLVGTAVAPTPTPCSVLNSANAGAVIGLDGTRIENFLALIDGDEYVSKNGSIENVPPSRIHGNVFEYKTRQYSGRGRLDGTVTVNATLLDTVNTDALNAAADIAAQTPTQVFGAIRRPTLITGNGGLNIIDINGSITASVVLSGTSNDVFFINVSGTIDLRDRATLAVADGVTAGAVLYNLTGHGEVEIHVRDVVNGTILAPNYDLNLDGEFNGAIIGGGRNREINLFGARVNQPDCR